MKELKRSCKSRLCTGVCGGIGEYFGIDPVIIRLLALILIFVTKGIFLIFYAAASFIMPLADDFFDESTESSGKQTDSSENNKNGQKTKKKGSRIKKTESGHSDEEFDSYFS